MIHDFTASMNTDTADPLDWTVDQVVSFLCHNPDQPWSQSATRGPRPDPASFETALRDNFVTGEVLLHDVNKAELREDLGLKSLGHVSSMLRAIRYLQDNSLKFKRPSGVPHFLEHPQSIPPPSPFSPFAVPPRLSSTVRSETSHAPGNATPSRGDSRTHSLATVAPAPAAPRNPEVALINSPADNQVGRRPESSPDNVLEPRQNPIAEQTSSADEREEASNHNFVTRPHEQIVIDSSGKKRRRLELKSLAEAQNYMQTAKVAHARGAKVWYMGPERVTHSDVFYSPGLDENDRSFMMIGSDFPTAQRLFVNRSLSHFYQQEPFKLIPSESGKGSEQWAMLPYRPKMVEAKNPKLFTLYTTKDGKVTVSKEQVDNWPQVAIAQPRHQSPAKTADRNDPYTSLLQRYPPHEDDRDLCPLYGDSASEGEYDEETLREMQDEQEEAVPHRLTQAEAQAIIMECISDYKAKWRQNGLQKEESKARKLWLISRRFKRTNQSIKALKQDMINLEKRLEKLQKHICDNTFSSRTELLVQCQSMEQTVLDIEKNKYRVSTLEQESCPRKTSTPPRRSYVSKAGQNLADEESLHSESDYLADDDPYDFIDDTFDMNDAPHGDEIAMTTPSTSDSDDDIISPSGIRRNSRRSRRLPFRDSSSPSPSPEHYETTYIDLTTESPPPEELKIETPPLNPVQSVVAQSLEDPFVGTRTSLSLSPGPRLGPNLSVEIPVKKIAPIKDFKNRALSPLPPLDDIKGIKQMDWGRLQERKDRRRLLIKLLSCLPDEEKKCMASSIAQYDVYQFSKLITKALKRLLMSKEYMPAMGEAESMAIMRTASLYISWVNCTYLQQKKGIPKNLIELAQEDLQDGFGGFFRELSQRLVGLPSKEKKGLNPLREPYSNHTDTPHKKRKREIKESQTVKMNQRSAQMRVKLNEEQRKRVEQKMESMGVSNTDPTHQAVSFRDPIIYLDPHIGKRVMPHQLSGIQFMWRELLEDENEQGCLLAHTMGLGKTMQVISLLSTIAATASSDDPDIRRQVPSGLRESKYLIISPAALIENWYEEFIIWTPPDSPLGPIRKITSANTVPERLQILADWDAEGGVLILGYEIFRGWVNNPKSFRTDRPFQTDEQHNAVLTMLLEGPSIVVVDEAHKMKNANSKITQAARQFRTKRRIALTGSPLANNLLEYYHMVNWIAEGYLGDLAEFKANFVEPIEEGLYADSTRQERRKSLIKLKALNNNLEPKLNRADIGILEGSLPPKTEFVLTIPLTPFQKAAYDLYVERTVQGEVGERINSTKLWSWLAILSLCCNHPSCFRERLLERASDAPKPDKKSEEVDEFLGDEQVPEAPLPDKDRLISEQEKLFSTVSDIKALELSYRMEVLSKIVAESIKAGDKLLIFSQSLSTLNYIEHMMRMTGGKYRRLDGQTPVQTRQAATKHFNQDSQEHVYLISTRAGGLGLNIPGANRVVIFDFGFSPMWEQQAVGRAYRLGQKKPVFVYRFVAGGTFEEMIYNRAMFKTQLAFRVVDKKNPIRSATKPLKNYLFPAKAVPQSNLEEFIGKDPHVLDKILNDKDTCPIRSIILTKTFDRDENDKLSLEEEQRVQQETSDLTLRRTDPVAYQKLMEERQRALLAATGPSTHPISSSVPSPYSYPPYFTHYKPPQQQQQQQQPLPLPAPPVIPSNAHNDGPPPLAPDMIS